MILYLFVQNLCANKETNSVLNNSGKSNYLATVHLLVDLHANHKALSTTCKTSAFRVVLSPNCPPLCRGDSNFDVQRYTEP